MRVRYCYYHQIIEIILNDANEEGNVTTHDLNPSWSHSYSSQLASHDMQKHISHPTTALRYTTIRLQIASRRKQHKQWQANCLSPIFIASHSEEYMKIPSVSSMCYNSLYTSRDFHNFLDQHTITPVFEFFGQAILFWQQTMNSYDDILKEHKRRWFSISIGRALVMVCYRANDSVGD